ncbi:MAG TPA: DNA-processing protein DprA [Rhodanobacteraceae bacterium]|jgi:DNA processing protein|nr:DNA-processing protein DprA [Rhodanobacteraceae bacterium]
MDIESNRDEIEAWLILLRAPGLGTARLHELIDRHGGARGALEAARSGSLRGDFRGDSHAGRNALRAPDMAQLESDLDWLAEDTHSLLTLASADFPPLLREVSGAPAALFVVGDASALWQPQIAIVGSRNASHGGLDNARNFARALCAAGLSITSGLAEGIDAAAHTCALDADALTIAVLGTGPDLVFPIRHRELAARIAKSAALVSEFPPGTPGRPENFPRRNRIIAGLALGTLVVEAGLRSGSLITARCAGDQGREVFAIPGSIHNPLARGCHRLIRQGATLVESADEILDALGPLAARLGMHLRERLESAGPSAASASSSARDSGYLALLAALGHEAQSIDALAERTGIGVPELSSMLLVLELEREVASERGGLYVRCGPN